MQQTKQSLTQGRPITFVVITIIGIAALLLGLALIIFAHYHERAYVFLGLGAVCLIGGVASGIFAQRKARTNLRQLRKEVTVQLRKMDHTALIVQELERSRWFYGEVLGLQEVPRPSNFTFGGSWFQGLGFQIHLILASDTSAPAGFAEVGEKDVRIGRAHHIAFEVDDVEKALTSLRAHNIEIVGGPQPRGDGVTQFYIYDPDRNFLEIFAWDQKSTV